MWLSLFCRGRPSSLVITLGNVAMISLASALRRTPTARCTLMLSLLVGCVLLTLALPLFLRSAIAAESKSRATLRGLSGVEIIIEDLGEEATRVGLSKSQLQTDVEDKLRQAGIPVLTRKEALEQPGRPGLYVRLQLIPVQALEVYLLSIEVAVVQQVMLARNSTIRTVVPTWRTVSIGAVGSTNVAEIQEAVGQHVNHFINAYLAVNAKVKKTTK